MINPNPVNNAEEYKICPFCKKEIIKDKLKKHLNKHRRKIPITKNKGILFWYSREIGYDDFSDICSYIKKCLDVFDRTPNLAALTIDANLLIDCITELEKHIPTFQVPQPFPEFFSWNREEINRLRLLNDFLPDLIALDKIHSDIFRRYTIVKNQYVQIYKEIFSLINKIEDKRTQLSLLKKGITNNSSNGIIFFKLDWDVIPSGCNILNELTKYYSKYSAHYKEEVDNTRIKKICSLKPDSAYKGKNSFMGYSVFVFNKYSEIICECPIIGNATYLLRGDWKALSKLNKSKLLSEKGNHVRRIVHQGDWFSNLKASLTPISKGNHKKNSKKVDVIYK